MTGMAHERVLGVGAAALLADEEVPLPPGHPLEAPGLLIRAEVDRGRVVTADLDPRFLHRSAEKLMESRDWRQVLALADRHDWLGAVSSEVNVALAMEAALGITPPERATWTRLLLCEATRIAAALAFVGPLAPAARDLRAHYVDALEAATGSRVHPACIRVGGVAGPIPRPEDYGRLAALTQAALPGIAADVAARTASTTGLGVLTAEAAEQYGLVGPVGRASGLALDLRIAQPYLAYAELGDLIRVPTRAAGDVPARYEVLLEQCAVAADLVSAAAERLLALDGAPVDVPLPKSLRLPEGTTYVAVEGPIGMTGCLLVGSGEKLPWRLRIRSASFATLQAVPLALAGAPVDRIGDVLMSFPVVLGDVGR
jgi:NADH-quinone oxidoreductase subunit D